jgi:hypothetical protein
MLPAKTAVFIASRFEEFAELRTLLRRKIAEYPATQFAPIDLNDGRVSHHPPLTDCLAHVRRSEFMILLLGDEYGSAAPGSDKSFTHLEYDEAIREESGVRVLAFCIGEHYRGRRIRFSDADSSLGKWQREIEKRHTVGFFEPEVSVEQMAQGILEALLSALYELRFGHLAVDAADQHRDLFDAVAYDQVVDDSEVTALEARSFELRGLSIVDDREQFSEPLAALVRPAAVAAYEQREEARRAIKLADYGCAVTHLKRAIEHRPLDLMSNFWLAMLYVSLGRKHECLRARELSERAARIALNEGEQYRAAASYMLAARAARLTGHDDEALSYARLATDAAPRYAKARIELARCLVTKGDNATAMKEIGEAAGLYFPGLREVFIDPLFAPLRTRTNALIEKIRVQTVREAQDIVTSEARLAALTDQGTPEGLPDDAGRRLAMEVARASAARQHVRVCTLVASAKGAVQNASSEQHRVEEEVSRIGELVASDRALLGTQENYLAQLRGHPARIAANWAIFAAIILMLWGAFQWHEGRVIFGFLTAAFGCYLAYVGAKGRRFRRRRLAAVRMKVQELTEKISEYNARRSALLSALAHLQEIAAQSVTKARQALDLFEDSALSCSVRLLPFVSLFTCKRGDIVRILNGQLETFVRSSGRQVEIVDTLPRWFEDDKDREPSGARLYKVTQVEPDRLVLSRAAAYINAAG